MNLSLRTALILYHHISPIYSAHNHCLFTNDAYIKRVTCHISHHPTQTLHSLLSSYKKYTFSLFLPHPLLWEIGFQHSIRSPLRRFRCPLLRGEMRRILLIGQGSKRSKVVSQWALLSWKTNLDIWGKTNLGIKGSLSARTSVLFRKARVTTMIRKQRAKLVMATARWAVKHPVYGLVILRLGIYTDKPNVSKLCSFLSSMNSPTLISVHSRK